MSQHRIRRRPHRPPGGGLRGTQARLSFGYPGRRLTISRHRITISLGRPGSGLHATWRRSWKRVLAAWRTRQAQRVAPISSRTYRTTKQGRSKP
jgi:hypothetical protein